jgi:hypothetical protein
MVRGDRMAEFRDIIDDAIGALTPAQRRTTDLYLDRTPYAKGAVIGPRVQEVRAKKRCLVVFVDENPRANFGHDCRYRLYDARSHKWLCEERARFPPYRRGRQAGTLVRIYDRRAIVQAATGVQRERYAILFSGNSERRHLNQLEYAYRMLTERYCFKAQNILVLYFDGTISFVEPEPATNWPKEIFGSSSQPPDPYKLAGKIFGKGDRAGFKKACLHIAATLQPQDLVFIQTSGHGDGDRNKQPAESYLLQHDGQAYYAGELCQDLTLLGQHDSLLVLMEQCFSAGFIQPLLNAQSTFAANRLSVACASKQVSFPTADYLFNSFGAAWIASHLDTDVNGNPIPASVDQDLSTFIEAREAYDYAAPLAIVQNDLPAKQDSPAAAGDIRLA